MFKITLWAWAFVNINYITVFIKEESKLHFPDFLVHSEVYLEPSQASLMEIFWQKQLTAWVKPLIILAKKLHHRCLSGS